MATGQAEQALRLAYLTTQYPSVSHTFIRREIEGLEALGCAVRRFSIRPGSAVVDPADTAEVQKTYTCLAQPKARLLLTAALTLARRPGAALRALRMALAMSQRSDRGLVRHLAYLIEAAVLLPRLQRDGVSHLHVHFGTNAAAVARLMRCMGGPRFSMTVHGPDEFDAPAAFSLGDKIRESAFTIGVSSYGTAQLRRWVPPEYWNRIHMVHCTVDESWLAPAPPVDEASRTLVCVGRLSAQKGQILLVDAFARLVADGADGRLVLVGDGEMRTTVEARIAQHGLADRVTITGWQAEAQVRAHLASARVFVLPSFAEGLPVVIMEALAQERPVISTYIAGIPELVRPGENGWLVPAGDTDALCAAMSDALSAPVSRLHNMGRAGRARVMAEHHRACEAQKLHDLFLRAAGEGGTDN